MSKLHLLTRSGATFVRLLEFLISALILAIFSYFLAVLSNRDNAVIPRWQKAVEGMSGAAVIYTAFAVILTFFLGGITIFAFLGMALDICFCGCMIAIAVLTRAGARTCGSVNDSPIGVGHRTSCHLQRVVFAVAIIGAVLFAISIFLQVALSRSHKREKRYGPSPANNYTSGSGKRKMWQRKPWQRKNKASHDAELGTMGEGALADGKHNNRASDVTGTTAPVTDNGYGGPNSKYAANEPTLPAHQHTSGVVGNGKTGGFPEMEAGAQGSAHRPYVQHDPSPYAEVVYVLISPEHLIRHYGKWPDLRLPSLPSQPSQPSQLSSTNKALTPSR
ncbi:MAG: hypothetical protein Q9217_005093 [Psora testacea]